MGEKPLAESVFQGSDLAADGGLGQAELRAGTGNTALTRRRPEIEQVVVVQPLYRRAGGGRIARPFLVAHLTIASSSKSSSALMRHPGLRLPVPHARARP